MTDMRATFRDGEGDAWFKRNADVLSDPRFPDGDLTLRALSIADLPAPASVLEIGCSNGWRLAHMREQNPSTRCVGVDPSPAAIADGCRRFPGIVLHEGTIDDIPNSEPFDLVICSFVLHWVDRSLLLRAASELDRCTRTAGHLVITDFAPAFPTRNPYTHLPAGTAYTYKQDYAEIFLTSNLYSPVLALTGSHGSSATGSSAYDHTISSTVLVKDSEGRYRDP